MAEVKLCNNSISQPFTLTTMRNNSLIRSFLLPQDIHIKDREGNSALHFAATNSDTHLLQMLLNAGTAVNDRRIDGCTPLYTAIESGQEENIKVLLNHGARIDLKNLFSKTPLHLIACLDYQDADKTVRLAKLILNRGVNIKILLNECTDSGETVLHHAVLSNNVKLIKLLLEYGANINAKNRDGKSPLYFAVECSNTKILNFLLENGARVNDKMNHGFTALHEAIIQRSEDNIELLLSHGAEVNSKDIYGKTPLHLAARLNYLDEKTMDKIVKLLLDKGADVNDHTNSGETAFLCAVINGNERLVRLFLEHGANVNTKNYDGKSPLHFAIQYSNKNIVKLLLDKGASIDDRTSDGKLALHVAVAVEDENMVKILLNYDADVNAIDKSGKTPLSLAFEVAHMRSIYNPWNGFNPFHSHTGSDDNIFDLLIKHIAKFTNVCEENLRMINNNEHLHQFYVDCQIELSRMKKGRVCDNISMYKVLTRSTNALVSYSRNRNLAKIFDSDRYAREFPIYYPMLKHRFSKAQYRRRLMEPSAVTFASLLRPYSLPDIVTNEILSYLTIEDLMNLQMS
ncbi:putative ankyrin repeat protein RF_0381 [Phymastichus coffea]|uniref:putative ankyrin repeat protein RF_0381 n=1 Tax=Phymastichus coffea TaxID=108790 RepID=UPI00273A95E2|nr:putative ankyrin repeat protein RF_0381 [Phymastichus coffea]